MAPTAWRTPLFLALSAAGCAHAQNTAVPPRPQSTELAPVLVQGRTDGYRANQASVGAIDDAPLHDVPATVVVVTRDQLDDRQPRSLSDVAHADASLGDSYAPVGYYQDVAIRGFALDLATGLRLNDLSLAGEQRVALENKQRVEILKGLAGIGAGVIAPGGLINYVTKRPDDVRQVTLGTDSHGSRHGAIDLGAWLTPRFGLRFNGAYEDIHSDVEHTDGRRNFYALAADWKLTDRATLRLDSEYQSVAQRSVSGYQLLGGTELPSHPDRAQLLGYQPWQQPVGIKAANTTARFDYAIDEAWTVRLDAGHSRSVIQDNVAFAYGCFYAPSCADGSVPGNYFAPNGDYDIYDYRSPDDTRRNDEARAVLTGHLDTGVAVHTLSVGIDGFRRTVDQRADVYDYVGTANVDQDPPPYFAPSPNQPGPSARRLSSWQRAAFAQDRVRFGKHWQLLAGARVVRLHERAYDGAGAPERDTRLSRTLPQAAVLWQPGDMLTTYVSYSEGLSLGAEAPHWTSNDGEILPPLIARQLEAGIKLDVGDDLSLTASAFRIHRPYQFAQPDDSAAGFTFVQQGQAVHQGIEFGASGRVSEHLRLSASATWLRARAEDTGTPAYEGHQVVNVPRVRTSVLADYTLPKMPKLGLLGGWRYSGAKAATADAGTRVDGYHVFDAGLRYRGAFRGHAMTWRLMVDNVFNRFYWRDTGSAFGDYYLFPGARRLARLSVSIDF